MRGPQGGIDFREELGLVKAALLYADEVELVSVAGSFVASLDRLGRLPTIEQLEVMRRILPKVEPDAPRAQMDGVLAQIDAIVAKLKRHRRPNRKEQEMVSYLKRRWPEMEAMVEDAIDSCGARDFRVALGAGRLKLRLYGCS